MSSYFRLILSTTWVGKVCSFGEWSSCYVCLQSKESNSLSIADSHISRSSGVADIASPSVALELVVTVKSVEHLAVIAMYHARGLRRCQVWYRDVCTVVSGSGGLISAPVWSESSLSLLLLESSDSSRDSASCTSTS